MRLIPRSSRRFSTRLVDYTYPELRSKEGSRKRERSFGNRSQDRTGVIGNRNSEARR